MSADNMFDEAYELMNQEKYLDAIELYEKALEINENNASAWINLGLCYRHINDFDKAIQHYNKALQIDPEYALAYNNMGWVYHLRGDEEKAAECYKKALKIDPAHDKALVNLTNIYNDKGEFNKAIEAYRKALEKNPDDYYNLIDLGIAYRKTDQYDKAIDSYKRALDVKPEDKLAYNNIGYAYHCKKDYVKALDYYIDSLKLDSAYDLPAGNLNRLYDLFNEENINSPDLWYKLAKGYKTARNTEKALIAIKHCLDLDPDYEGAEKLQKKILKDKKAADAAPQIEKALNEAIETFISVSRSVLLEDIIEFVKEKVPDIKVKGIDVKLKIIDKIKQGSLKAELDGDKLVFLK